MDMLSSFFAMGGYAGYVWPSYGLAVVVMLGVLIASVRGVRRAESDLDAIQRLRPARQRRRAAAAAAASVSEGAES
jgi:heme exporter protein D